MTTPPRPDQETDPPAMVLAPGGSAGIFRGRLVIVTGGAAPPSSGVFVYDSLGNLIGAIVGANGTDPIKGTAVFKGVSANDGTQVIVMVGRQLEWLTPSDAAQFPPSLFGVPSGTIGNALFITTGNGKVGGVSADLSMFDSDDAAAQGVAGAAAGFGALFVSQNSFLTSDSWHQLTINQNGWTGNLFYRRMSFYGVAVTWDLTPGTTADGTAVSGALPTAYRPTSGGGLQHLASWQDGTRTSCSLRIGTSGVIFAYGTSGTATNFRGTGIYYLDPQI